MKRLNGKSLILLWAALMVGVPFTTVRGGRLLEEQPAFCVSCHEMKHAWKEWIESGAAEHHPDCIQCHAGPGFLGMVESQWRGLRFVYVHLTASEEKLKPPFKAKMPPIFCLQCHPKEKIDPVHRRFKNFSEKMCADCHKHRKGWEFLGEYRADSS